MVNTHRRLIRLRQAKSKISRRVHRSQFYRQYLQAKTSVCDISAHRLPPGQPEIYTTRSSESPSRSATEPAESPEPERDGSLHRSRRSTVPGMCCDRTSCSASPSRILSRCALRRDYHTTVGPVSSV